MSDHHDTDRTPYDEREERDLEAAVGRLPRTVEPRRDLWPGIEARLGARRPAGAPEGASNGGGWSRYGWRLALAAALLVALSGIGLGLWRMALPGAETRQAGSPEDATPAGAAGTEAPSPAGPEAAVSAEDPEVVIPAAGAFGDRLMAALERKRYQLGPDASAAVEADIARLGLAIAELVAALSEHPENPTLYHHLAARQRQEADLLMRLNRL